MQQEIIDRSVAFHGHLCPGLAFGIRAGAWAREEFGTAQDEQIVLITETDMCGVDALQVLVGCTFGKGNLVFHDYGKVAFSFFRRRDGKKVRLMKKHSLFDGQILSREEMTQRILDADIEEIFSFEEPQEEMPELARIHKSVPCSICGEDVMESRLTYRDAAPVCIPCLRRMG